MCGIPGLLQAGGLRILGSRLRAASPPKGYAFTPPFEDDRRFGAPNVVGKAQPRPLRKVATCRMAKRSAGGASGPGSGGDLPLAGALGTRNGRRSQWLRVRQPAIPSRT